MPIGPINYAGMIPDLSAGFQGLGEALAIRRSRVDEQEKLKQAAATREKYRTDLTNTMDNPTPQAFAALTAKYPGQREAIKQSWDILSDDQKQQEILSTGQVYNALMSGNIDIAESILDDRIEAVKNSGGDPAKLQSLKEYMARDSKGAAGYAGLMLSSVMSPEDFASTFKTLGEEQRAKSEASAELTKKQAEARKAAVEAKFAESEAVMDLEKKGWDITKIQEDVKISKENAKIAAARLSLEKQTNEQKKEELRQKILEMEQKRDDVVRSNAAKVEEARINMDNMLNTAERILATPMDVVGSAAGPVSSKVLTILQSTSDFEELINNFDAQAFLAQIPNMKGLGALSDAEGKKVAAALQNMSLRQSPERLIDNVREAVRIIKKARTKVAEEYGVPETIPDTPAATSTENRNITVDY